jgi:hypothetical protein
MEGRVFPVGGAWLLRRLTETAAFAEKGIRRAAEPGAEGVDRMLLL